MKLKHIILSLFVLVLIASSACVFASEFTVNDYKFFLTDNFTVDNQDDESLILKTDDEHFLSFTVTDEINSDSDAIKSLEDKGYSVTNSKTFEYNGDEIHQIDYSATPFQFYLYHWKIDDNNYAIAAYGIPEDDLALNWNDSPVKMIFDTIEKA